MFISRLKLYQFRNLVDQEISFLNGPVFVTGQNGNGKTNLVEALFLLSGSRSFRTNSQSDLVRWGSKSGSVFATTHSEKEGARELGIILHPGKREAVIDGTSLPSFGELVGRFPIVSFSPDDLSLVKGAPAGRRRFLDRHMVDLNPAFLEPLVTYQRALANKNAVLKEGKISTELIEPWNRVLSEQGTRIVNERLSFLALLTHNAASNHAKYAPADGDLTLKLESDFVIDGRPLTENEAFERLMKAMSREEAMRGSVIGPHKDDVDIRLNGTDARAFASQGQTRSIVLSLKMAVIEKVRDRIGEQPVVVLDDVDSELDEKRSEHLFKLLLGCGSQVFITGTERPKEERLSGLNYQVLQILRGAAELVDM